MFKKQCLTELYGVKAAIVTNGDGGKCVQNLMKRKQRNVLIFL